MKDYSSSERQITTDNIFSNNRLGIEDTFESGKSLTIGTNLSYSIAQSIIIAHDAVLAHPQQSSITFQQCQFT